MDRLIFAGLYRLVPSILKCADYCETGHHCSLAPRRVQIVLALEVATL
jgi:hypothetical protein